MNLLERVLTLLRANLSSVIEKADNPERVLRQLQLDMHNQLVQVKTEVAKAIAESHALQKRSVARKAEADGWLKKAEQAVQQGNDNAARVALTHYNDVNKLIQRYHQQKKEQEQLVLTLRTALRQLEAKLAEVDTTIDLLVTRKRNALIQQRVMGALQKTGSLKDNEQVEKAGEVSLNAETRAYVLADLENAKSKAHVEQPSPAQEIEQQLQQIKGKGLELERSALRPMAERHTSPLATPQPQQAGEQTKRRARHLSRPGQTQAEPSTDRDLNLEYLKKLLDSPQGSDY